MNIVTIEEQTFKQVCERFISFANQVERICKQSNHQSEMVFQSGSMRFAWYQHPKFTKLSGQWETGLFSNWQ